MITYGLRYTGSAFIRIVAEEGDTTREIATCRQHGDWPQVVRNAELIVAALNASAEGALAVLVDECDKRGLPHSLPGLLRHIENNHAAVIGFKDLSIESLERRLKECQAEINYLATGEDDPESGHPRA